MVWLDLFARLDPETRSAAAAALAADDRAYQTSVAMRVSATLRMREGTVRRAGLAERTRYIEICARRSAPVAHLAMTALHTGPRRPLLIGFLDAAGVAHDERGFVANTEAAPDRERLRAAVNAVRAAHPSDHVEVLLDALEALEHPVWVHLADARTAAPVRASEPLLEPSAPAAPVPPPSGVEAKPTPPTETVPAPTPEAEGEAAFSPLDEVLRRAIDQAAAELGDGVRFDFVRDLVEEVVMLKPDRRRSYAHLGFLDALEGRTLDLAALGTGPRRRAWYLCGAVEALERAGKRAQIVELFDRFREETSALLGGDHDAGPRVAPLTYRALVEGGRQAEAVAALGPTCVRRCDVAFLRRLLDDAATLLREGRTEEAAPILDLVDQGLAGAGGRGEDVRVLRAEASRRRAHVLRQRGDWTGARERLESVLRDGAGRHASRVLTDLGLVACRLRRLADVALPDDASQLKEFARDLEPGRSHFEESARQPHALGGHGDYVLGLLEVAQGRFPEAAAHLDRAVAAMAAEPKVYRPSGLLGRAEAALALALAEGRGATAAERVADLLRNVLSSPHYRPPTWLVQGTLFLLATADGRKAAALLEDLGGEWLDAGLDILRGQGVLAHSQVLRERLLARAANKGRRRKDRWDDALALLAEVRGGRDELHLDHGQRALEALESMADDRPSTERFLTLLEDRDFHDPYWDAEAVEWARVRLLDQVGRTTDAAQVRLGLCHRLLSTDPDRARDEVPELVREVRDRSVPVPDEIMVRVRRLDAEAPPAPPARPVQRAKVLFVGGNEKQKAYADEVRRRVQERHSGVQITFEHTGWSSNWGRELGGIERKVREHDVVVLMRFVRTLLGEAVRRTCSEAGKRWVPCTGHGRDSMIRAIEAAVRVLAPGPSTNP